LCVNLWFPKPAGYKVDVSFSVGVSVASGEPMTVASLSDIWQRVQNDAALRAEVERLRKVKAMEVDAYTRLKVRLPFFCCGAFNGGVRKGEHFVGAAAFVLDIDHYSNDEAKLEALKMQLAADERVALLFRSPGGDGLKVVFVLDSTCADTKVFSDSYKAFAFRFAEQYELTKYMDFRTADATRACFLSADATAYINPMAELVSWQSLVAVLPKLPLDNTIPFAPDLTLGSASSDSAENEAVVKPLAEAERVNCSHNIAPDVYADILRKLQTKARPNPMQREVAQPERLQLVVAPIAAAALLEGVQLLNVKDIQYGKQLRFGCGNDLAEVNVFYGKRGFSVVEVVRTTHSSTLAAVCVVLSEQAIFATFKE
jgi:VirE N-terminal domain